MRLLLLVFLCGIVLKAAYGQGDQLFYYLQVTSSNADVHIYVNGFPVYDIRSEGEMSNQVPINLALVGKGNQLTVHAEPLGDNAFVRGGVAAYKGGDVVSTDDNKPGPLTFEFDVVESTDKSFQFNNEKFNVAITFRQGQVIEDHKALRDYGVRLLTLIRDKQTDAIIKEMSPKIKDVAVAFGTEATAVETGMRQMLESSLFKLPITLLSRNEINVFSYCDGRVYELTDADGNPLIYVKQNDGTFSMRIFVCMIDGSFRIIR